MAPSNVQKKRRKASKVTPKTALAVAAPTPPLELVPPPAVAKSQRHSKASRSRRTIKEADCERIAAYVPREIAKKLRYYCIDAQTNISEAVSGFIVAGLAGK